MAANATVSAAAGALVVGGAAFAAGKRAAHTEDPDFDLVWLLDCFPYAYSPPIQLAGASY